MKQSVTYLRMLRHAAESTSGGRLSLEKVAEASGVSYRALWNIETRVTKNPPRATLLRVVEGLAKLGVAVSLDDTNRVLAEFGYRGFMLPLTDDERTRMAERWQQENETNKVPAFLVDSTQRLLCWNTYALYTSDLVNHEVIEHAQGATLFDLIFSQSFAAITAHVSNRDEFFLSMLSAIKAETQVFQDESWCQDMIANARRRYPSFDALWAQLPARVEQATVYTFGPLHVASPDGDLVFQLLSIPFGNDHRLRTVYYHPLNAATVRVWSQWLEHEE